jgi:hypothetical protein
VFSILPSLGIVATMFGLIKFLGIPFSWLRLTVIGSLMYEVTAADAAASAAAGANLAEAAITPEVFVTIAIVMSVGIILGGVLCVIGLKKYSAVLKGKMSRNAENQTVGALKTENSELESQADGKTADGALKTANSEPGNRADGKTEGGFLNAESSESENRTDGKTEGGAAQKKKKLNFSEIGNLASAAIFIALCSAYIGGAIGEAFGGFHIDSYTSVVPFISMLIAVGCMALITKLQKKYAWLQSFSLSFSMLVGMVSAVPVSLVLGAIF